MIYLNSHVLNFLLSAGESSTPPDNTLKVALVTGAAVVVAAAITAFAATFQRSRPIPALLPPAMDDEDLETELRRRAKVAEDRASLVEGQIAELTQRIAKLERYLYLAHIDPNTGEPL